ncbi:hypothetical protein COCHEDRAFT_1114092, partial [Bipolaris maydis C5]
LKALNNVGCVLENQLLLSGQPITDPIERGKAYDFTLLSIHDNRKALKEYQASPEHHRYSSKPYREDTIRLDFKINYGDRNTYCFIAKRNYMYIDKSFSRREETCNVQVRHGC